jgi:signal transduction histidine kinase
MRLADFIRNDMERILVRWEAFAATHVPPAGRMGSLELRDHAQQILEAVAADLRRPQSAEAQASKSMGLAPVFFASPETAAQTHAVLRAKSGFNIEQLAAEYRALRASVLGLWMQACLPESPLLDDLVRFNEAIDQAVAESIAFFSAEVDRSRDLLLAMLSHDMRSPLQTINMTALYLRKLDAGAEVAAAARRLGNSGARLQSLLNELLDYNRMTLGLGLSVTPVATDLGLLCTTALDQIRAAFPERRLTLEVTGDCRGTWDAGRLVQLIGNLVSNAVDYGDPDEAVRVEVLGRELDVTIRIANRGEPIEAAALARLFQPLKRGTGPAGPNRSGLGLGLHIVSEIAKAHGGEVDARSDALETVFTVRLPRAEQDGPRS